MTGALRFALFVLRGLRTPRYGRHVCADYLDDVMCYPPSCALCGRRVT